MKHFSSFLRDKIFTQLTFQKNSARRCVVVSLMREVDCLREVVLAPRVEGVDGRVVPLLVPQHEQQLVVALRRPHVALHLHRVASHAHHRRHWKERARRIRERVVLSNFKQSVEGLAT